MRFWKKLCHRLSTKQKVVSFDIGYSYETEADTTMGVYSVTLQVKGEDAIDKGYVWSGNWKGWDAYDKIGKDMEDVCNKRAETLLLEARNGNSIIKNNQGVWVQGKHIVFVGWSIKNLEWEPLTYEEYLAYEEITKTINKEKI